MFEVDSTLTCLLDFYSFFFTSTRFFLLQFFWTPRISSPRKLSVSSKLQESVTLCVAQGVPLFAGMFDYLVGFGFSRAISY